MTRGIVMSLEGKRAVVLAPGGQFASVPRREHYRIGDEVEFDAAAADAPARRRRIRAFSGAAAACVAACLLIAGSVWLRAPSVVAYVSLDVNPSVELGIDGKERVRVLQALNRDAEPIVAALKYKGKDVGEVAEELADELAERHLLRGGDSEVVLASVAVGKVDDAWQAEVTGKMKQAIEKAGSASAPDAIPDATPDATPGTDTGAAAREKAAPEVTTLSLPKEIREKAKANGVSAGKMAFWLKAESQGHEVSLDELKTHSLKKIAASWGGVKQVLGDGSTASGGEAEEWKKLLQQAEGKERSSDDPAAKPGSAGKSGGKGNKAGDKSKSDDSGKNGGNRKNGGRSRGDTAQSGSGGNGAANAGTAGANRPQANGSSRDEGKKASSDGNRADRGDSKDAWRSDGGNANRGEGQKVGQSGERGPERKDSEQKGGRGADRGGGQANRGKQDESDRPSGGGNSDRGEQQGRSNGSSGNGKR